MLYIGNNNKCESVFWKLCHIRQKMIKNDWTKWLVKNIIKQCIKCLYKIFQSDDIDEIIIILKHLKQLELFFYINLFYLV